MTAANAPIPSSVESERRAHEPSMEEILASIRKIIADDDALPLTRSSAPPRLFETNVTPFAPAPVAREPEPQLVEPQAPEPVAEAPETFAEAPAVRLDAAEMESFAEVGRELSRIEEPQLQDAEVGGAALRPAFDAVEEAPVAVHEDLGADADIQPVPDERPYDEPAPEEPAWRPEPPRFTEMRADFVQAQAAPAEPPAILSAEANASVASAFQALSASVQMASAEAIDRHVRDMLRPMLKQWLDDNLPVMVERLVRAEIERVARGGR